MSISLALQGEEVLQEVRTALESLGVKSTTPVKVEVTGDLITLRPILEIQTYEIKPGPKLDKVMAELDHDFGNTFRSLAK